MVVTGTNMDDETFKAKDCKAVYKSGPKAPFRIAIVDDAPGMIKISIDVDTAGECVLGFVVIYLLLIFLLSTFIYALLLLLVLFLFCA